MPANYQHNPLTSQRVPIGSLTFCLLLLLVQECSFADTPSISYIFPAGGQRGTSVAFHVGGHYLHEVCPFEMLGPGVTATPQLHRAPRTVWFEGPPVRWPASQARENYPKDQAGAVTIAADAPLGERRFRLWTSQGVVPTMKFVVGDLPEIVERETDGKPVPVGVQLPVTINGRIFPREDVDIWTFPAESGRSYTCEVTASRLGSPLDSRLEILDPAGRRIAENVDGKESDSFLQFTAAVDGEHQVRIHDINFGGLQHYVYRLTIHGGPHINSVFPLGGRRGKPLKLQLAGVNLPEQEVSFRLPEEPGETWTDRLPIDGSLSNAVNLDLSDLPEYQERGSDKPREAVSLPAVLNGRILEPGEEDVWKIRAAQGEKYTFEIRAAQLGSRLDSVLTVRDSSGKVLGENDNSSATEADSRLELTIPVDGDFSVTVKDRAPRRGGPEFAYRLVIARHADQEPDFRLKLPADSLTLERGKKVKLAIEAERIGSFTGAVQLSFGELPQGITVADAVIPEGKSKAEVKLKAESTAKIQPLHLKCTGSARIGDQDVVRSAFTTEEPVLDHLLLAVSMPTPFKVVGAFETNYVSRGATYFRRYRLERGGFEGPLWISLADRQIRHLQGITGPTIRVPAGVSEFEYQIKLPPWMQAARTSRSCVMAVGVITDADGSRHKVSYTSDAADDQIIMMVTTEYLSVEAFPKSVLASPGKSVPLRVKVGRGKGLSGPVRLELRVPEHIRGVAARDVVLPPNESEIEMSVTFADDELGPFNMPLVIRGTAQREGHPYTAEGKIEVVMDE